MSKTKRCCSLCSNSNHKEKYCILYSCKHCLQLGHRKKFCPLSLDEKLYDIFPVICEVKSTRKVRRLTKKLLQYSDLLDDAKEWHIRFHRGNFKSRQNICDILELQNKVWILQAEYVSNNEDQIKEIDHIGMENISKMSEISALFSIYPMPISSGHFHKQLEQPEDDLSGVD